MPVKEGKDGKLEYHNNNLYSREEYTNKFAKNWIWEIETPYQHPIVKKKKEKPKDDFIKPEDLEI